MAINKVALRNLSVWVVDLPGEEPVGVMLATPIPVPVSQGGTGKVYLNPNAVLTGDGANPISDEPTFKYDGAVVMVGVPTKVAFDGGDGTATFGTDTPYGPGITISPPESKVQIRGATGELVVDNDASKSLSVAVAADAGQGAFQLHDMNFRISDSTLTNILDVVQGTRIVRASDRLVARIAETEEAFVLDGATVTVADGANDNVATATPVVIFSGPTANWSITGMSNGLGAPAGSIVVLVNISSYAMTVVHNASSSATNRFYLHGGANVVVPNGHAITVYYRATGVGNRWTDIPEAVTGSGSDTYVTSWDGTDILTGDANFKYDGSTVMVGSPTKIALSAGDGTATFGTDTPYADGTTIKSDEVVTTQGYVSVDLGSGANVGSVVLTAETAAGGATVGKIHLQAARQGVTDSYIAINNDDATVSTIINPDTTSTISRGMDVIFKDTADAQTAVITAATGYGNFAGLTTVPIDLGIAAVFQTNLPVAAGPLTINTSSGFVTLVDSGLAAGFNAIQITTPQDHAHSWVVEVLNATGFTMTVKHQDGGAGANDKFICPTLADVTVATGGYAKFAYGSWPTIGTPGWLLLDWRT